MHHFCKTYCLAYHLLILQKRCIKPNIVFLVTMLSSKLPWSIRLMYPWGKCSPFPFISNQKLVFLILDVNIHHYVRLVAHLLLHLPEFVHSSQPIISCTTLYHFCDFDSIARVLKLLIPFRTGFSVILFSSKCYLRICSRFLPIFLLHPAWSARQRLWFLSTRMVDWVPRWLAKSLDSCLLLPYLQSNCPKCYLTCVHILKCMLQLFVPETYTFLNTSTQQRWSFPLYANASHCIFSNACMDTRVRSMFQSNHSLFFSHSRYFLSATDKFISAKTSSNARPWVLSAVLPECVLRALKSPHTINPSAVKFSSSDKNLQCCSSFS